MEEGFHLASPDQLQAFLKEFPEEERREGHKLFARGHVVNLVPLQPQTEFSAGVRDGSVFSVLLTCAPTGEWSAVCACGGERCEHMFATASAVMAEYRSNVVRELSGSLARRLGAASGTASSAPSLSAEPLESLLRVALRRDLTGREADYLRKIRRLYERFLRTRQLTMFDLYDLGPQFANLQGRVQDLWPSPPKTELEFWLFLAHGFREAHLPIPEFMEPVTDLSLIQERLTIWRRSREVQNWKSKLGTFQAQLEQQPEPLLVEAETDLQLALDGVHLRLEYRAPGASNYVRCTEGIFSRLSDRLYQGGERLTLEAEIIWQVLLEKAHEPALNLNWLEPELENGLTRLLRMPQLESRFVSAKGEPLRRVAEALRWEVVAPETPDGDYKMDLVQADGTPAPKFLASVGERPTYYLTPDAVYSGPEQPNFTEDTQAIRIPAAALETAAGVSFLRAMRIEPPARIRDRVRVLPYSVTIRCELDVPDFGPEECTYAVSARSPDGQQLTWNGYAWSKAGRAKGDSGERHPDAIIVHDRSALGLFPAVLDPLNLKVNYHHRLSSRVTRKFPEVFAAWLKSVPPQIKVELMGELSSFLADEVAGSVKLEVAETEIDWFDLRVVLDVADTSLSPEEIKLLLNAKGKYVRLEGKGWKRLRFDLSADDDERLARLGLSPRELSAEPQKLHALQLADPAARRFLPAVQVEQVQRRADEIQARVSPGLPAGVSAQLRPYQLEGYHFLAYLSTNRFGGILADDMGLGKTLQTLAWLLWLRELPQALPSSKSNGDALSPAPSLVVCPKSVMDNWHAEAAKFTPGLAVRCWPAAELERLPLELASADVHVLNYNQLRSMGERLLEARWLAVILDEGQYIKNPNSQTAQIARALRASHRLVLTGTPIENRLLDLWSLMAFAMPGVLGNRASFARLYDAKDDPFARRRLAARARPFLLRRTKAQVAKDLPDRVEEDLFCEIEGEQKMLYTAELKSAQQRLLGISSPEQLAQQQFHFLTSLLRLRQICCHPRLIKSDSAGSSAKTDALLEQLEPLMEEGEKVLVFSQFVEMLNLLRPALEERKWPVFYLAGHTENRGELVRSFQSAQGPAVFLISLKAGGFGLNLTAANYVVLFDPWWNPAVENQAIDRTHRIGQTETVIAYRVLIKNSIEEKIRELQKRKKALAEDVLGEEKFSQSLSLEDLKFLFSD